MPQNNGVDGEEASLPYRRQVLQGIAGAGTIALAGCPGTSGGNGNGNGGNGNGNGGNGNGNGGNGNGNGNGGNGGGGTPVDDTLTVQMGVTRPGQANYNVYGKNAFGVLNKIMYEIGAKWYPEEEKWVPLLIEDWEYPSTISQGNTIQVQLYDGASWINGDDYTAEDFIGQMRWRRVNNDSVWDFIEDAEQTGDYTAELSLAQKIDTKLFENALIGMGDAPTVWNFKFDVYREYLERMEDASGAEGQNAVLNELSETSWGIDEALEKGLANGPFKPKEASETKLILEKNEDYSNPHITADDITFPKVEGVPIDSPQKKLRSMRNKEADAIHNVAFTSAQANQIPDRYEGLTYFTHSGGAFCFNCREPPLDNRKVRWALSNVWRADHDILMRNLPLSDKNKDSVSFSAGMSQPLLDKWLGDRKDEYMHFDGGTERAAELLRGEGFTKENGKWYKPNGEQFTLSFKGATFHSDRTQTGARLLSNFGIETEGLVQETTTWFGETIPNRNYDITNWWVGQSVAIPYQGLQGTLIGSANVTAYPKGVPSVTEWEGDATSEFVLKVPPIGEPEGSLREVDINALLSNLAAAQTDEEKRPIIQELAWVWNWMDAYWGPWLLYLASEYYDTGDWEWPEKDSSMMQAPTVQDWPMRMGYPKAKTE